LGGEEDGGTGWRGKPKTCGAAPLEKRIGLGLGFFLYFFWCFQNYPPLWKFSVAWYL
jgi:hypothetical protein